MQISPFQSYKLLFHRDRVEASLAGKLVYPVSVEIDLSNTCNHKCPFCSFGTEESQGYRYQHWDHFPYPRIITLLKELRDVGVESLTFTGGGEPLMHKQALQVFREATALGFQWGLVTNGYLLRDAVAAVIAKGATFVRVSLDAGTPETHSYTHGVTRPQYDNIIANLANLRSLNPSVTLGASFCVMDRNLKEIYKAAKDVKGAGANYLEVRPTFPTEWRGDGWGMALTDPEAAKTEADHARMHLDGNGFSVIGMMERFDNAKVEQPVKNYTQCRIGPLTTVIGATGRIWHCCVQRGQPFFDLGSVLDKPFTDAWAEVHRTRDASKIDLAKCPRCRYDGYNELLEHAVLSDGMHRDFI